MPQSIFRFGQLKYAEPFVNNGLISFGPAANYNDSKLSDAQRDNELRRSSSPDIKRHQFAVTSPGSQPKALQNLLSIKVSYDIRDVTGEYLRYYILCCSLCNNRRFYSEFPEDDCCITIHDVPEFHRRFNTALRIQRPEWGGGSRQVAYFQPDQVIAPETTIDLVFMKEASYAWQQEFRFALIAPLDQVDSNRIPLDLGGLTDICSIANK